MSRWSVVSAAITLVMAACSYYSTSGSLPAHIKTVAVPLFADESGEYGVKEQLTDALTERFMRDARLRVADARTADSIISGIILQVREEPFTYDENEQVAEYRVWITASVKFEDVRRRKVIWQDDNIAGWGIFNAASGPEAGRRQGIQQAVAKLAEDIVNNCVVGW